MSSTGVTDFNQGIIDEYRANRGEVTGALAGAPLLLITHTGAKSGVRRTTPLVCTMDGDRIVVIASKAGAPTHPDWYHNIVAHPRVTVELGGETFEADAQIFTEGPERDRLFDQQAAILPTFKEYQEKTDRVIPVVVLQRA